MNNNATTRGRGRGRGKPRGASRRSLTAIFEEIEVGEPQPSTSTSTSQLDQVRSQRALTKKRVGALSAEAKKTLLHAKRSKEMSRFLLPDAPERKKKRLAASPTRVQCPIYSPLSDASPPCRSQCLTPSSGGSMASTIEVPSLSPHYWRRGIDSTTEVIAEEDSDEIPGSPVENFDLKQSFIQPKTNVVTILSDVTIRAKHDSGSDEESENEGEMDMATLAPAIVPSEFSDAQERALGIADMADDRALIELAPEDVLEFNWSKDPEIFKGKREKFIGKAGPTFPLSDLSCPLDAFQKIWDPEFLNMIVMRTNSYAAVRLAAMGPLQEHSRFRTWRPTDIQEIIRFFAISQLHSLAHLPVQKDYFKSVGYCAMPEMASLMTYGRFMQLKRFLHFADPLALPREDLTDSQKRLHKIQPVIDRLTDKFKKLYMPGQSIAIDESLLLWKGRLAFAQKIGNKAAKVGIKSFELCESATGYLWNFFIYGGATKAVQTEQTDKQQDDETDTQDDRQTEIQDAGPTDIHDDRQTDRQVVPDGATAKVVYDLARPLFNLGHTLVMDNYYNSPLLARCLKKQNTDLLGTLRVNREFVPDSIKSMVKAEMRVGEIACSNTSDLTILLWRDANIVSVVSTYHKVEVAPKEKYGKVKYKPQAILDYNMLMGGVDKKDQLLSAYPLERTRNQVWYKKLFLRLMNVSILNAYILYKCKFSIEHRRFRHNLAEALVAASQPLAPSTAVQTTIQRSTRDRPKLPGNHFIAKGSSKFSVCVWCRNHRSRKTRTAYICEQCDVSLCLENCFKEYHT